MKILLQIGVVFGLYWVSQCIEQVLPIPFPASVISLLLLLLLLLTRVIKVDHIRVSIMNYAGIIWENAAAFFTICVVSMVLTYGATVAAVRLTVRLMGRREEEQG